MEDSDHSVTAAAACSVTRTERLSGPSEPQGFLDRIYTRIDLSALLAPNLVGVRGHGARCGLRRLPSQKSSGCQDFRVALLPKLLQPLGRPRRFCALFELCPALSFLVNVRGKGSPGTGGGGTPPFNLTRAGRRRGRYPSAARGPRFRHISGPSFKLKLYSLRQANRYGSTEQLMPTPRTFRPRTGWVLASCPGRRPHLLGKEWPPTLDPAGRRALPPRSSRLRAQQVRKRGPDQARNLRCDQAQR